MLCYVHYLCKHAAGVRASVGDFMGAKNVTLTRYLLYCQKAHTEQAECDGNVNNIIKHFKDRYVIKLRVKKVVSA